MAKAMPENIEELLGPESSTESDDANDHDYKPSQSALNPCKRYNRGLPLSKRKFHERFAPQSPNPQDESTSDPPSSSFSPPQSPVTKEQKLTGSSQLRNRSARTANDIDILEGLPIRQWKQVDAQIGPPPVMETLPGQAYFPEHPMPRDYHLLPEHSQRLLRLARAPTAPKPSTPQNEDEEKDKKLDDDRTKDTNRGIALPKWSQVPRHLEEPEVEYLAKRRPGLPPVHTGFGGIANSLSQAGPMRKTKLKRFDADGNAHVYEVLAPVGQKLEGEIDENDVETVAAITEPAAAPGTVVEGIGIVNAEGLVVANDLLQSTPTRKKPLPPRRKKKGGPGRGKKGPVALREAMERGEIGADTPTSGVFLGVPGANASDDATSAAASTQGDTPMPDAHEGDEGSSEEGEDGEDDGSEEGELVQTPEHTTTNAPMLDVTEPAAVETEEIPLETSHPPSQLLPPAISINREASSSPDLPLASAITNMSEFLSQSPPIESGDIIGEQLAQGEAGLEDGDVDLFHSLEKHLENSEAMPGPET